MNLVLTVVVIGATYVLACMLLTALGRVGSTTTHVRGPGTEPASDTTTSELVRGSRRGA